MGIFRLLNVFQQTPLYLNYYTLLFDVFIDRLILFNIGKFKSLNFNMTTMKNILKKYLLMIISVAEML